MFDGFLGGPANGHVLRQFVHLSDEFGLGPFGRVMLGAVFGLAIGLVVPLFWLLRSGLSLFTFASSADERRTPNQGSHRSLVSVLFGMLIGGPFGAVVCILLFTLITFVSGLPDNVKIAAAVKVAAKVGGLLGGLGGGFYFGGLFYVQNLVLRIVIWQSGLAPLRYIRFLNYAKDLLFLRQVGGGYIFTHRLLREYFASLSQDKEEAEPRTNAASAA